MSKQWKCKVCSCIQDGSQPPDACPRCGASRYAFVINAPLSATMEATMAKAFAGESQAYVRNLAYAKRASREGYPEVARLFQAVAEAEKVHADEYLKYLEGVVGETEDNLKRAFENEIKAKQDIYPGMIRQACDEERDDVAWSFSRARDVEERHADLYRNALGALEEGRDLQYHVCLVCGYVFDQEPPDQCPVCQTKKDNYKKIF